MESSRSVTGMCTVIQNNKRSKIIIKDVSGLVNDVKGTALWSSLGCHLGIMWV